MSKPMPEPNQPTADPNLTCSYHAPEAGARAIQTDTPTIPGYAILSLLGRGGMGEVYKATHLGLHRTVALKIIRKDLVNSKGALLRFQREMRAAGNLDHPNVIAAQDAGETGGVFYFAMDYCEGIDLKQYVEQKGPLAVDEACDLIRQAALGLQHINEHGLVHRDIKPSNLLLTSPTSQDEGQPSSSLSPASGERAGVRGSSSESGGVLKILDLGLARLRASEDTGQSITDTGIMMGTPDYTAPEQITNAHGVDIRADLYSLGCTFYFLLTGQAPFKGGTVLEKLRRHQVEDAPAVEELRKDVPKFVAAGIAKLMAKRPEERLQTPGELVELIGSLGRVDAKKTLAKTGTRLEQPKWRFSRRQIMCASVAAVPILGAGGWLLIHLKNRRQDPASVDGAAQPRSLQEPKQEQVGEIHRISHSERIHQVLFHPKVSTIIYASGGLWRNGKSLGNGVANFIHFVDLDSRKELKRLKGHKAGIIQMALCSDSTELLSISASESKLWNVETGKPAWEIAHSVQIMGVSIAPNGRSVVYAGQDGSIYCHAKSTGQFEAKHGTPSERLWSVCHSPDGSEIVAGCSDGRLRVYSALTGEFVRMFDGIWARWNCYSPDGNSIFSWAGDNSIRRTDSQTGKIVQNYYGHTDHPLALALSLDGSRLLSGGFDNTVRYWDVSTGKQIAQFDGHEDTVLSVGISADCRYGVSGGGDNQVILWGLPV